MRLPVGPSFNSAGGREGVPEETGELARGGGVAVVGRIAGRGLTLVSQALVARLVGPVGFGLYSIGWTLVRLTGLIAPLGLDNGLVRYGSPLAATDLAGLKSLIVRAAAMAVLASSVLAAGVIAAAPWLATVTFQKPELESVLWWFAPVFVLVALAKIFAAGARTGLRMAVATLIDDVSQPAALIGLLIVGSGWNWGVRGVVFGTVASFAIAALVGIITVHRIFPKLPYVKGMARVTSAQLLSYSVPTSVAVTFATLVVWVDRLVGARYLPVQDVGVYQAASQVAIGVALVLSGINAVVAPLVARLVAHGERHRLAELYRISTKWALYVCLPVAIVTFLSADDLLTLIFGPYYGVGAGALMILTLAQAVNAATGSVGVLLIMTGSQGRWLALSTLMLVVNAVLCVALIPRWGLAGAAAAGGIAIAGLNLGGLREVRRLMGLWPYDRRYVKGLVSVCLTVPAVMATRWIPGPALTRVLAAFLVSAAVFFGVITLVGIDEEDRVFLHQVRSRFVLKRYAA
jgi:O-antigen/teichoic acid export membrane protein